MKAVELLDWLVAVVVVLAVLWGTTRHRSESDNFSEKDTEEDEIPDKEKI